MHRNKTTHIVIFLLMLLATYTSNALAFSPSPADLYISISGNKTEWLDETCRFMTEGGCAYFTAHEADTAWLALQEAKAAGASVHFIQKISNLTESLELWQIDLTVFTSTGEGQTYEVYATLSTQSGRALLDRLVMFDQTLISQE